MDIRPLTAADLDRLDDIDGTIDSADYLHIEREGEGLAAMWRVAPRPLRERLIAANRLSDETRFSYKQLAAGIEEGLALVAEHEGALVAAMAAMPDVSLNTVRVVDLRVDFDFRRQGLGSVLLFRAIGSARDRSVRAVHAAVPARNHPAACLLHKAGFDLAGLDTHRQSNHDLVKECVELFWYLALD